MAGAQTKNGFTPSKNGKVAPRKGNTSILNFFQKTDGPPTPRVRQPRITQFVTQTERLNSGRLESNATTSDDNTESLFLEDKSGVETKLNQGSAPEIGESERRRSRTPDDIWGDEDSELESTRMTKDEGRSNENGSAVKKRKVDSSENLGEAGDAASHVPNASNSVKPKQKSGPFIDESDSEDELEAFNNVEEPLAVSEETGARPLTNGEHTTNATTETRAHLSGVGPSSLVSEVTPHVEDDEFANFDNEEDDEATGKSHLDEILEEHEKEQGDAFDTPDESPACVERDESSFGGVSTCPICQMSLVCLNELEISVHVNNCLDDDSNHQPSNTKTIVSTENLTRIERASIARPPQQDPYYNKAAGANSAFSKLMDGNAEDTAWSTAAAKEVSSRGKQAYQRTCPFYKIIPGFSICVDAFRYGAVEGCSAYFLSHFHTDHYMGLTSSWRHGPIYCSKVTGNLVRQQLKVDPKWVYDIEFEKKTEVPDTGGVHVTTIPANHCPGSSIFLFEKPCRPGPSAPVQRVLHCGDFRASRDHLQHPLLRPIVLDPSTGQLRQQQIDACYLDTTYLTPKYAFPSQEDVIRACADTCVNLNDGNDQTPQDTGKGANSMSKYFSAISRSSSRSEPSGCRGRLLVVMGTYSIGKERICVGIARALNSKIYATSQKQKICACLEDAELSSLLTDNPLEAQVHMQTIFEIRPETLRDYLASVRPHFTRVVGIRPTGWNYRPPATRATGNPSVSSVLHSPDWKPTFTARDMLPQRGSTEESACFGVPYSEHSSFRELTMFCCGLRIGRIIPTVNVGSRESRERMKAWFERWDAEKRRNGFFAVDDWR